MVKEESNFGFIQDINLRENLDIVFDHIIVLISLSESEKYGHVLKSSFRKTIIIYTASIIEALLLYILKQNKTEAECALTKRNFKIIEDIYRIDKNKKIVLGEEVEEKEKFSFNKINLDQIKKLCKDHALITEILAKEIDTVRDLRNRQHLGGLSSVDRDYSKKDLEFVFFVAGKVKRLVKNSDKK